jgi:hypothetical protein
MHLPTRIVRIVAGNSVGRRPELDKALRRQMERLVPNPQRGPLVPPARNQDDAAASAPCDVSHERLRNMVVEEQIFFESVQGRQILFAVPRNEIDIVI